MADIAKLREKYPFIVLWGEQMGSFAAYVNEQVQRAEADGAPVDAYRRDRAGTWKTVDEITAEGTRRDMGLPELPKPPLGLGDRINGGTIIAYRAHGKLAWALVLCNPSAARPYVLCELPTDRYVTAWPSGHYYHDIAAAVAAWEETS